MARNRLQRDRLNVMVAVERADTGARVGHLVDLSMSGLCVSGRPEQLEGLPETLSLTLVLPWPMHERDRVTVSVACTWLNPVGEGLWHAGYRVTQVDEGDLLVLEHLAGQFSTPDHS